MGTKEPVSSSLSKVDIRQMIEQLEDAKRLLKAIDAEFPHLHPLPLQARAWLGDLISSLEKPDQGKGDADEEDEDTLDYEDWVLTQPWPDGATHATLDKQGGCIWWKGTPILAPRLDLGWKARHNGGDLVERYYDPAMPFSGPKWRESLRQKPEDTDAA